MNFELRTPLELLVFKLPLNFLDNLSLSRTQVIWDAFIADIQTKDSGKKKSKKRANRDFKAEVMKKMKVRLSF